MFVISFLIISAIAFFFSVKLTIQARRLEENLEKNFVKIRRLTNTAVISNLIGTICLGMVFVTPFSSEYRVINSETEPSRWAKVLSKNEYFLIENYHKKFDKPEAREETKRNIFGMTVGYEYTPIP